MIELYFKNQKVVNKLRESVLGPQLDTFASVVSDLGYSHATIRTQIHLLAGLIRWVQKNEIDISDINEDITNLFLKKSARKGALRRGDKKTLRYFLDHLRVEGLIDYSAPILNDSPLECLQKRYENYLRKERGLATVTASRYWPYLQRFLIEQFGDGPIRVRELNQQAIEKYFLQHAHDRTPKVAQLMVTALRSFLRFLFRYGETERDLSAAVPTIPTWRLTEIPKYLKPEELDSLLEVSDRTTPIGRRDYSILLLIARLGLRAGEVVALELDDINWRDAELMIRGKGLYHDCLPLPQQVGKALAIYLQNDRPICSTRRLFITMRAPWRGFKNSTTVSTIVRRAVQRSGLNPSSKGAHLLRYTLATDMLRQGASMSEIRELLRHRSPNSTEIYAKVDIEGLRSIARPWPERGGVR